MNMTDEERNAKIESIKQATIARLLGDDVANAAPVDEVEFRDIDKNWNSKKCWMDYSRITNPMNNDMAGIAEFNKKMHDNKGVVVTIMRDKSAFAADPIK